MIAREKIKAQFPHVLAHTDFSALGERYEGKVRDTYERGDERVIITTDRLSCFDRVLTSIPFKGEVLQGLAVNWFSQTQDIIENHLVEVLDPNVMIVKNCEVVPIEVVVRGYLAGSAWRDYSAGRSISGIELPPGMRSSQKLPSALLTPSIKAPKGSHDTPISEAEIIAEGRVAKGLWEQIREVALALFERGRRISAERGLILVDTKYEFGTYKGALVLVDEIHTVDSSRYWIAKTYQERFEAGELPEMLDKEPIRQWLLGQGFKGDGEPPAFTDEYRIELTEHFIHSYELVSGEEFTGHGGDVQSRIRQALSVYL